MKKRVLVLDDSELVLEMAKDFLVESGFDVAVAMDLMEANSHLFKYDPHVIVIDVMMPMLSGDKTARVLKQNKNTSQIPILLLSSKPEDELRRLVAESGAEGFLRKPFTKRDIVAKIEEVMQ